MMALSIRQPWAWLIIHGGKDIENRAWNTQVRGRFLVHASKGMTRNEYEEADYFALQCCVTLPPPSDLHRGGFIGSVELTATCEVSASQWFVGDWGFVLRHPRTMPFRPWTGRLGFFQVPDEVTNG